MKKRVVGRLVKGVGAGMNEVVVADSSFDTNQRRLVLLVCAVSCVDRLAACLVDAVVFTGSSQSLKRNNSCEDALLVGVLQKEHHFGNTGAGYVNIKLR